MINFWNFGPLMDQIPSICKRQLRVKSKEKIKKGLPDGLFQSRSYQKQTVVCSGHVQTWIVFLKCMCVCVSDGAGLDGGGLVTVLEALMKAHPQTGLFLAILHAMAGRELDSLHAYRTFINRSQPSCIINTSKQRHHGKIKDKIIHY